MPSPQKLAALKGKHCLTVSMDQELSLAGWFWLRVPSVVSVKIWRLDWCWRVVLRWLVHRTVGRWPLLPATWTSPKELGVLTTWQQLRPEWVIQENNVEATVTFSFMIEAQKLSFIVFTISYWLYKSTLSVQHGSGWKGLENLETGTPGADTLSLPF